MKTKISSSITPFLIYGQYITIPLLAAFYLYTAKDNEDAPFLIVGFIILTIGFLANRNLYDAYESDDSIIFERRNKEIKVLYKDILEIEVEKITRGHPIRTRTKEGKTFRFYPSRLRSAYSKKVKMVERIESEINSNQTVLTTPDAGRPTS